MITEIDMMKQYDPSTNFITPDRGIENHLYRQGIHFKEYTKGETGWTYWVYDRTPALVEAVAAAVSNRSKRKEELRSKQNAKFGLNGENLVEGGITG